MTVGLEPKVETLRLRRVFGTDSPPRDSRGGSLPAALSERYGGDLAVRLVDGRPTVAANFVTTLDGVVAFDPAAGQGGGAVSGYFEPDRFVMGLLRSLADVVMVGAGTLRSDKNGRWVAASVHPASAIDTARLRADLGLPANPTTVVVSGTGDIDPRHPGLSDPRIPVVIATTEAGCSLIEKHDFAPRVDVVVAPGDEVDAAWLVGVLGDRGVRLIVCEGGPHLIGSLINARLIDELFLTLSPQLAGRDKSANRLSLVENHAFSVTDAPWAQLADLRVAGSHVFTRYRFGGPGND